MTRRLKRKLAAIVNIIFDSYAFVDMHISMIYIDIRSPRNNVDWPIYKKTRKKSLKTEKKNMQRIKSISLFIFLVKNMNHKFPRLAFFVICYEANFPVF